MTILAFGINHKTAPVELRERLAVTPAELGPRLERLLDCPAIEEGVLLSTCNRIETYVVAADADAEAALAHCGEFFAAGLGGEAGALAEHCYHRRDLEAVDHLFEVIAGLDSLALGESQIAGQVRDAFEAAQQANAAGFHLSRLFEQAFHVNKRVRTETGIGEGSISISHMAVDLAVQIFGDLKRRRTLVLGAGKMSGLTIQHLKGHGAETIFVSNRTGSRAETLAQRFGLETLAWDEFPEALETADIVISSTSAPHPVVRVDLLREVMAKRGNSPLFIIDIATPRDVEPEVDELYNVYLYNIDDLQRVVQDNLERREHEVVRARAIIHQARDDFATWSKSLDARTVIVDLRQQYDDIRQHELERLRAKLGDDTADADWENIEDFSTRLMNKYLHQPTSQLRNPKDEQHPTLIGIVRQLFNLSSKPPEEK